MNPILKALHRNKPMLKYILLISVILISQKTNAQNTWVQLQPGMYNISMVLKGDSVVTLSNAGDFDHNYIRVNYSDWKTGNLIQSDSILYVPPGTELENPWNMLFLNFNKYMVRYKDDIIIGINYYDSIGSAIKWQSGLFSLNKMDLLDVELNVDTFESIFNGIAAIDEKLFVIIGWKKPIRDMCTQGNFIISSLSSKQKLKPIITINNSACDNSKKKKYIRALIGDNQSDSVLFARREFAWDFKGTPRAFETYVWKIDTSGKLIWAANLNQSDSFNMVKTQIAQKDNGNILAIWNNKYYRPYKHPEYNTDIMHPNDSCTLWMAELDYKTGKVLWRKNYRRFLLENMTLGGYYPKNEEFQNYFVEDVVKVKDGIIWAGTLTIFIMEQLKRVDMPFLFKTDFEGNAIWYRDYMIFPDNKKDEGVLLYALEQTPDGGFIMAGENRDFGREYVQSSILIKLDSFGCLVPGCHLKDNINELVAKNLMCDVYPNPATSSFMVKLANNKQKWTYQIINNTGQMLQNGNLNQEQNQINTQQFPNGIYQLILQNTKTQHYENHSFIIAK